MNLAYIPSPGFSKFSIGSVTIHMYAICILTGIIFAVWILTVRWKAGVCQRASLWMPSDSASTLAARSRSPSFGVFAVTLSSSSRVCTRAEPTMTPSA